MKKMLMVLVMMMVAAVTFADAKSNAKSEMEEIRVERQEDFDAWLNKVNAEVEARDAELKAAMEEVQQFNKELRDAIRKAQAEKAKAKALQVEAE